MNMRRNYFSDNEQPPRDGSNSAWLMLSVFCCSKHSLWKILQIGEPGRAVGQFFCDVAWAKILAITSVFIVNCVADVPPACA